MRQRERLAIGERKYIYSQLNDKGLWLEAGILFAMAMQGAVERQVEGSDNQLVSPTLHEATRGTGRPNSVAVPGRTHIRHQTAA